MIHKITKLRNFQFDQLERIDSPRTENFESLVDLFTLLSLVLIIATFLFGYPHGQEVVTTSQMVSEFKEVSKGNAPPAGIPENTLVLIQSYESGKDIITLVVSKSPPEIIYQSGQGQSLWNALEGRKEHFIDSTDIHIIIDDVTNEVNSNLQLELQRWLAVYSFEVKVSFTSNVEKIKLSKN